MGMLNFTSAHWNYSTTYFRLGVLKILDIPRFSPCCQNPVIYQTHRIGDLSPFCLFYIKYCQTCCIDDYLPFLNHISQMTNLVSVVYAVLMMFTLFWKVLLASRWNLTCHFGWEVSIWGKHLTVLSLGHCSMHYVYSIRRLCCFIVCFIFSTTR